MIGTLLNVAGIVVGGIVGLTRPRQLTPATEAYLRVVLAAFTVFYGLRLTWFGISGSVLSVLRQLLIVIIALMLGRLLGRLLGLQRFSNHLGQGARERMTAARPDSANNLSEGFKACAVLFCAAPLGILGAIQDGLSLSHYFYPLAIKAVMDGLATLSFVSIFGRGVLLAAVPVLAFQGSLSLLSQYLLEPFLRAHQLLDPVNAVSGLLIFCVALIILGLKKIELADYLPSLAIAPLLTWVSR